MVVEGGGGQPHAGGQLVVEQRQLGDEPLGLLLLGGQRGQTLADAHQGLDELPLGRETHGLWRQRAQVAQRMGTLDGTQNGRLQITVL